MSLIHDGLRAFAAGAAACCAAYGAFAAAGATNVGIDNFTYTPASITVKAGARVEWENGDDIPHTVAETNGRFISEALDTGDKFSFTFSQPGTYDYFCSLHPYMTGKVVVTP